MIIKNVKGIIVFVEQPSTVFGVENYRILFSHYFVRYLYYK